MLQHPAALTTHQPISEVRQMAVAKHISKSDVLTLLSSDFWSNVDQSSESSCWPWKGCVHENGYGRFSWRGFDLRSHRVAFAIAHNTPVPGCVMICHRCDNPLCCNPRHLFLGVAADNNGDAREKGRAVTPRGLANGNAKLSDEDVRAIIESDSAGVVLAHRFGVSQSLISMIRRGSRRKMVGDAGFEPATFRV